MSSWTTGLQSAASVAARRGARRARPPLPDRLRARQPEGLRGVVGADPDGCEARLGAAAGSAANGSRFEWKIGNCGCWRPNRQRPPESVRPFVRLLPAFDTYILGYADRDYVVAPEHQSAVYHGGQTVPVVLREWRGGGRLALPASGQAAADHRPPLRRLRSADQGFGRRGSRRHRALLGCHVSVTYSASRIVTVAETSARSRARACPRRRS